MPKPGPFIAFKNKIIILLFVHGSFACHVCLCTQLWPQRPEEGTGALELELPCGVLRIEPGSSGRGHFNHQSLSLVPVFFFLFVFKNNL